MKKIMSLAMVVLFSVACAHKSGSCASGGSCGCGKDKAEKACACGAKDKASCKCPG